MLRSLLELMFQTRKHLSAVPAPVARIPSFIGDQAKAFTAALWDFLIKGIFIFGVYTNSLLSLPPEAKYFPLQDHLIPHTSYLCVSNKLMNLLDCLMSYM